MLTLRALEITAVQDHYVQRWHGDEAAAITHPGFLARVARQHHCNFVIWHLEDEARRTDAGDAHVARHKRLIDQWNQRRNDELEGLDVALLEEWPWACEERALPLNTETPGAAMDRLSVMALRLYHMREEALRPSATDEHRARCAARLELLQHQRAWLTQAVDELLADLRERRKRLVPFRQLKMYNDPATNPALYRARAGGS